MSGLCHGEPLLGLQVVGMPFVDHAGRSRISSAPGPQAVIAGAGAAGTGTGGSSSHTSDNVTVEHPLAFPEDVLRIGQDVAVWYKQRADPKSKSRKEISVAFFGRVTGIRMQKGKSMVICNGPVSLKKRLPGITFQCAWYHELDCGAREDGTPHFALGHPEPEQGAKDAVCHGGLSDTLVVHASFSILLGHFPVPAL